MPTPVTATSQRRKDQAISIRFLAQDWIPVPHPRVAVKNRAFRAHLGFAPTDLPDNPSCLLFQIDLRRRPFEPLDIDPPESLKLSQPPLWIGRCSGYIGSKDVLNHRYKRKSGWPRLYLSLGKIAQDEINSLVFAFPWKLMSGGLVQASIQLFETEEREPVAWYMLYPTTA